MGYFSGDTKLMRSTGLHHIPVKNEWDAQKLIDDLMDFVGWTGEKVYVFYDKKQNKFAMAHFTTRWGRAEIRVKAIMAQEVGTLVHELAHYKVSGHGRDYKRIQEMLIRAYMRMNDPKIYNNDVWVWNERRN